MTVAADIVAVDGESKALAVLELVKSEHAPWDENAEACESVVRTRMHTCLSAGDTERALSQFLLVWVGTQRERSRCALVTIPEPPAPQRRPTPRANPTCTLSVCTPECLQRYLRARGGDVR